MFNKIYKYRAAIFSIIIYTLFTVSQLLFIKLLNSNSYILFSLLGLLLVVFLTILDTQSTINKLPKVSNLLHFVEDKHNTQLLHHFTYPILLFLATNILLKVSNVNILNIFIVLLSIVSFGLISINIRAYYYNNLHLETRTHLIYDILKYILFILFSITILNLIDQSYIDSFIGIILMAILTFTGLLGNLNRYRNYTIQSLRLISISTIFVILGYIILTSNILGKLGLTQIIIGTSSLYYIVISIIHHYFNNNLTKKLLLDYGLWIMLYVAILIGLR